MAAGSLGDVSDLWLETQLSCDGPLILGRAVELSGGEQRGANAMAQTTGIGKIMVGVCLLMMNFGRSVLPAPFSGTLD